MATSRERTEVTIAAFLPEDAWFASIGGGARDLLGVMPKKLEILIIEGIIVPKPAFGAVLAAIRSQVE